MYKTFDDLGLSDITQPKPMSKNQKPMELQAKVANGVNEGKIERRDALRMYQAIKKGCLNDDLTFKE